MQATLQKPQKPGAVAEQVGSALAEILNDKLLEQRAVPRLPYFAPATVSPAADEESRVSAFVRDVSIDGIGLVHTKPIETGMIIVGFGLPSGRVVRLIVDLIWCRDQGNGWLSSGGRFLGVL